MQLKSWIEGTFILAKIAFTSNSENGTGTLKMLVTNPYESIKVERSMMI